MLSVPEGRLNAYRRPCFNRPSGTLVKTADAFPAMNRWASASLKTFDRWGASPHKVYVTNL